MYVGRQLLAELIFRDGPSQISCRRLSFGEPHTTRSYILDDKIRGSERKPTPMATQLHSRTKVATIVGSEPDPESEQQPMGEKH